MRYWTTQTLRIVITLSHLRALHDAIRDTFLKVTNIKLNGTETSFRRALISNNCHLCQRKNCGSGKKSGVEGGGGAQDSNSVYIHFYTNPSHKTSKKKTTT